MGEALRRLHCNTCETSSTATQNCWISVWVMSGVKTYRKLRHSSVSIDIAQAAKLLAGLPTPASQEYVWNSSRGDPRALTGLARRARPARLREGTLLKIHATLCEPFPRVAPIFNSPPSQSQTGPASRGDPRDLTGSPRKARPVRVREAPRRARPARLREVTLGPPCREVWGGHVGLP